jgi:glycosyltransferase involved in cell wall biosynthesis
VYKKLKILLLSPYLPSINTSGCARKIYDCLSLLQQRGHDIYLLAFCSEDDRKRIDAIKPYCAHLHLEYLKDYSRYPANSVSIRQKVHSLCKDEDIDILQCEKAYMSQYVPDDIKTASILIEHEILSVSFFEREKLEDSFINKLILSARRTKKRFEEKKWYRKFDKIIVFSENDKELIRSLYNMTNIEVIPIGINLKDYPQQETEKRPYDLIFVGNFSHLPNVDAVLFFYKRILPLIKNKLPNISIMFVGTNLPEDIKGLVRSERNITIAGYVNDILESYSKSKVFIAPIRYGTGMRLKILEALAVNMPVVSTSIGARGVIFNNALKIADNEKDFSDRVIELLTDRNTYEVSAGSGRSIIEKHYNWNLLLDKYENVYYDLLNKEL